MMNKYENLKIKYDYENFTIPPGDEHPSKKCHEIIAENIINKIETYEKNNYKHVFIFN